MRFFRRRTFRRRVPYRRRRRYSRRITKRVKRVERGVKRINSIIETKFSDKSEIDFEVNGVNWSESNKTAYSLAEITQTASGSGIYAGRIGRDIKVTSLYFRYIVKGTEAAIDAINDPYNNVRVLILIDKLPRSDGSAPLVSDVFVTGGDDMVNMLSPPLWETRGRYHIVYDKIHQVSALASDDPTGSTAQYWDAGRPHTIISGKKRIRINRRVQLTGTTNNINKNAIWILFQSDSGLSPGPTVSYFVRTKYQDA